MLLVSKKMKINCVFRNQLDKMVIVEIESEGIERVIAPLGYLEFKAKADAELKVYTQQFVMMSLAERIRCIDLEKLPSVSQLVMKCEK